MPNVTVTIRELKNFDTGLDLAIPHHTEKHGLLKNTVTCNVVAVSNLRCFKGSQHNNTDVVQFMVLREHEDFGNFRKKLMVQFPGTNFPPLPKTLFSLVEGSVKDQVMSLEKFLKFVAATKKLAISSETIEFLGFSGSCANKVKSKIKTDDLFEESSEQASLFKDEDDDNEDDNDDLFRVASASRTDGQSGTTTKSFEAKLFADQDYGDKVIKADELVIFSGTDVPKMKQLSLTSHDKDDEDLFAIDNNLGDLCLEVSKSTTHDPAHCTTVSTTVSAARPILPPKPKASKPDIPPKPAIASTCSKKTVSAELIQDANIIQKELGAGDILRYIEDNQKESEDLDLFS